jgi:hypothetical protein
MQRSWELLQAQSRRSPPLANIHFEGTQDQRHLPVTLLGFQPDLSLPPFLAGQTGITFGTWPTLVRMSGRGMRRITDIAHL